MSALRIAQATLFFGVAARKPKRKTRLRGHFGVPVRVDAAAGEPLPSASDAIKPLELPDDPMQGTAAIGGILADLPPPEATAEGLDLGTADDLAWGAVPDAWQGGDGSAEAFGQIDDSSLDVRAQPLVQSAALEPAAADVATGSAEMYRVDAPGTRVAAGAASSSGRASGAPAVQSVPGFDPLPPELASNPALLAGLREIRGDDVAAGGEEAARRAALSGGVKAALGEAAARASDAPEPGKMAKRKHQIGTLYQRAKVQELDDLQKQAQGARNRAEAKRKYGW